MAKLIVRYNHEISISQSFNKTERIFSVRFENNDNFERFSKEKVKCCEP